MVEEVSERTENPRAILQGGCISDPGYQREASSRRSHWPAVANPRISVWSIVEQSFLGRSVHLSIELIEKGEKKKKN
jgi:hypothetical protein